MRLTRRRFLAGAGGLAAAAALPGCAGFGGGGDSSDASGGGKTLRFMTWASEAEASAFTKLATAFEEANSGVTVDVSVVPYGEMFTGVDAQLQAGTAPDVFRVDYTSLGLYSSQNQLLDLTDYLDGDLTDDLIPALYQAVQFDGTPYGVPHQTDVTAVVYQPALFEAAGITSVPDSLDNAWSWEEFGGIADQLTASLTGGARAFAYDWQLAGAFRWLTWLFAAGGNLLDEDLVTPVIQSDQGTRALEFTRSFFEKGWVPANTSVKGNTYPDSVFISQRIAMSFVGDFLLPSIDDGVGNRFEWQATFQPMDERASTDLGGNALVATAESEQPELAAAFLNFMMEPDNQAAFCAEAVELPTRLSLVDRKLDYATRPDLMPVFTAQATSLAERDVAQVTVPFFGQVNTLLQEQLEQCFVNGRSVEDTLAGIADGVSQAAQN